MLKLPRYPVACPHYLNAKLYVTFTSVLGDDGLVRFFFDGCKEGYRDSEECLRCKAKATAMLQKEIESSH